MPTFSYFLSALRLLDLRQLVVLCLLFAGVLCLLSSGTGLSPVSSVFVSLTRPSGALTLTAVGGCLLAVFGHSSSDLGYRAVYPVVLFLFLVGRQFLGCSVYPGSTSERVCRP
jgi:hypothetical protein